MFNAANNHTLVVEVEDSISSSSENYSDDSGESAIEDQVGGRLQKKPSAVGDQPGGIAAVGASGGNASVAATGGSECPPFEAESQEGQLLNLRGALREHVRNRLPPPSVPAGSFGGIEPAHGPDDEEKKTKNKKASIQAHDWSR